MTDPCRFLEWDSEFFGRRIANVQDDRPGSSGMPRILEWCVRERIDCLYLLVAADDSDTGRAAQDHGFRLVDIRTTLERPLSSDLPAVSAVRPAREDDIPALMEIARTSHTDSRFFHDPGFSRQECERLYAVWIQKSCHGFADAVLVAEQESKPAGYITCHSSGGTAQIGLLAVADWARGRGVGRDLVLASLHEFSLRNAPCATVITQGRNVASQRLYQRSGFITRSVELWYHRWFGSSR
jgi:dTDP-4-amino-4,6-dideoxy-D-galactose acyltransferase